MNDTPSPAAPVLSNPSGMAAIANAATPVASMTAEQVTGEMDVIRRELMSPALTGPAKARLLDRQLALGEARWPGGADIAHGGAVTVLKGDPSAADPTQGETFKQALSGKLGHDEQANAVNHLDAHNIRAQQSEIGMTEAEFEAMEASAAPKAISDYRLPSDDPIVKGLFEFGASAEVVNLYAQVGRGIWNLSDEAFSAKTLDARAVAIALPRGAQAVAEAAEFIRGLPDDSPVLAAAILASTTAQGIFDLSRIARARKAKAA